MKGLINRIIAVHNKFMYGRYGSDELSKLFIGISIIFFILSRFESMWRLYYIAILFFLITVFRFYSKRIDKRTKERNLYMKHKDGIRYKAKTRKRMWNERKTHKYIKCEKCEIYFRVPKGAGNIVATCPHCKEKYKLVT